MKIAITSQGQDLASLMDDRFGRATNFIIYDLENNSYTCIDNLQNYSSAQGAGIQTAQNVINAGADVIITGNVGPKAFHTLQTAKVDIFLSGGITVGEAIELYKKGQLTKTEANNVEGHWI